MSEKKPNIDYTAILVDLEEKKQALDALIVSIKVAASTGAVLVGDLPTSSLEGIGAHTAQGAIVGDKQIYTIDDIPTGAFHGKSMLEAARAYLAMVKTKQTTREISDALRKGGIETTSSHLDRMVYSTLHRARKQSGEVARISGKWALSEWLPAGIRNSGSQQTPKRRPAKKSKKKGKKSKKTKIVSAGIRDKIEAYIVQHPNAEYGAIEIAEVVGIKSNVAAMLLGKLVEMNRLKKTEGGRYVSPMVR